MSLSKIAEEIRADLMETEDRLKEYDQLRDRQRRLQRALAALGEGEEPTRKPPVKSKRATNTWRPSAENIEATMAVLVAAEEPMSVTKIADHMHRSREVVRRALETLRAEGRVRIAGASGRGNAKLFAAMPEERPLKGGALNGRA
jgi:ATPase subunit of ABC transporter with duplicated ATPase domains